MVTVYRIKTSKKLISFGDDIRTVPVCGRSLSERQEEAFRENGLSITEISSESEAQATRYIVFDDDLYFTSEFVRLVLVSIKETGNNTRFGLHESRFNERFVLPHSPDPDENLLFNFFFKTGESTKEQVIRIDQTIFDDSIYLPPQVVAGGEYYMGRSECIIGRIASPFHLMQLNLVCNLQHTIKFQKRFPSWIVRNFGTPEKKSYYRALKMMNTIGKNCQVHPTAVIEGSVIGDNVIIGANAIVRFSHVGSGSVLSDGIVLMNCVLHENNVINHSNYISSSLLFDNVFLIHGPYQFSVFGKNSAIFAVINCDIRLDQENIKIPTDVGILDSNQPLMGIAYGHRSKVGGGNIIASGRIVPNDLVVNPPDNIIVKFQDK